MLRRIPDEQQACVVWWRPEEAVSVLKKTVVGLRDGIHAAWRKTLGDPFCHWVRYRVAAAASRVRMVSSGGGDDVGEEEEGCDEGASPSVSSPCALASCDVVEVVAHGDAGVAACACTDRDPAEADCRASSTLACEDCGASDDHADCGASAMGLEVLHAWCWVASSPNACPSKPRRPHA